MILYLLQAVNNSDTIYLLHVLANKHVVNPQQFQSKYMCRLKEDSTLAVLEASLYTLSDKLDASQEMIFDMKPSP